MTTTIAVLLGAGASKPLGIPTTDEMAKEFLETTENKELKQIIKTVTANPDIETVIKIVRRIIELPKNEGLLLAGDEKTVLKLQGISDNFIKTEKELTEFIRKKCLDPNQEKATENYLSLLKLNDVADVKIFTTNYDKAVENVCNFERLEYNDGFKYSNIDGFPILDPALFEDGDIQIYKLHGSVDWWSDVSRSKIFRLNLELEGVKNVNNLMIYPAQKEDVFNYPFNILQSILIKTLDDVDEFIVIGHKFADPNIVSAIKVALEQRPNFKLTIVSPSASKIKQSVFENNVKVHPVDETIENWLPQAVKNYRKIFGKKNATILAEKKRKEKELKDKIIGEHESSKQIITLGSDKPLFYDPSQTHLNLSDFSDVAANIAINPQQTCPNCSRSFNPGTLTGSYQCPFCNHTFS